MQELDCFLKRKKTAQEGGTEPPFLLPIFYNLTLQECELDAPTFFDRYQSVFEKEKYKFEQRVQNGETSQDQVVQSLKDLSVCRGVELEKSEKHPLTHKLIWDTANEVYKMLAGTLPMATFSPGVASGHLHEHINFPEVGHYIPRAVATAAVREGLNKKGICIIHGFGGSGKSTLAVQYAKENKEDQVIRFVTVSSGTYALIEGFQEMADGLGVDWRPLAKHHRDSPSNYRKALGQLIYLALAEKDQRLFLILDDVQAQHTEMIQDMLLHRDHDRVMIIMTTRDPKCFQRKYPQVALADFSEPEAREYVSQQLQAIGREVHAAVVTTLLEALYRTPMKLELAMRYLEETEIPLSDYIARLQQASPETGIRPQVEMGIAHLSAPSQLLLRYSALLDVTSIPLSLLSSLILQEDRVLREETLAPLVRLSLVQFLPDRANIAIHQEVQDSCRYYREWSEEANVRKATLLDRLVHVLAEKMPWVESNPDDRWVVARLYAPQAAQALKGAPALLGNTPEVAYLLSLMGQYRSKVDCSYAQGLEYKEQAKVGRYPQR